MALIRPTESDRAMHDAIPLDLEDLRRRAELLQKAAEDRARSIIEEARAERERLIAGAAAKGHAEGLERGLAEGRDQGAAEGRAAAVEAVRTHSAALVEAWTGALRAFESQRDELHRAARRDTVELACRIASMVTKRAVELDAGVVEAQLGEALSLIGAGTRLRIRVHPDDLDTARSVLPGVIESLGRSSHAELVEDAALTRGSVVATTDEGGEIDASIDGQLRRILDALMPAAPAEDDDGAAPVDGAA